MTHYFFLKITLLRIHGEKIFFTFAALLYFEMLIP